jgi:hypothetical protein
MSKGTNLTGTPDGAMGPGAERGAAGAEREPTALATMAATLTALDALVQAVPADFLERRPAPDE